MVIRQGEIYWINLGDPTGSASGCKHPHVIIQNNVFNQSRINTVVVCVITSNLKRATAPGNILLAEGEGNLPRQGVVNVSQIFTVDKGDLEGKIGTLSKKRVEEVLAGVRMVLEPRDWG